MTAAALRCELLFGLPVELDWAKVGELLAGMMPEGMAPPIIHAQRGGHAVLEFGPTQMVATWIRRGSSDPAAAGIDHAAHLVLFAEVAGDAPSARVRVARLLTLVTGAAALRRDCEGMVWNDVRTLVPAATVRKGPARVRTGRDPFPNWVEMRWTAAAEGGTPGLRTAGLAAFFGREVDLRAGMAPVQEAERIVGGLLAHVFAAGTLPEHGDGFRIEGAGDFMVERAETAAGPVIRVVPLPPPAQPEPPPARGPEPPAAEPVAAERGPRPRVEARGIAPPAAILFFSPQRVPELQAVMRAMQRQLRRSSGLPPDVREGSSDRVIVDWGQLRSLGSRQTEVLRHRPVPEALSAFLAAENRALLLAKPDLIGDAAAVIVQEVPPLAPSAPSVPAALLVVQVASALLSLPGARALAWVSSGVLLDQVTALAEIRRAGTDLPVGLCVAENLIDLSPGGRFFATRGLADLGEQDVVMTCDAPDEPQMKNVFSALVRAVFKRTLARRGDRYVNVDGAEFDVREEEVAPGAKVLKARLMKAPRPPAGLARFLRPRGWGAAMRGFDGDRLVLATHNRGKLAEIRALMAPFGVEVVSAADLGLPEPVETEATFEGNARIKAHAAARATGLPALSDDSGIEVEALDGAPGVYTADWAEAPGGRDFGQAMARVNRLLDERRAPHPRRARFVCTLCLAWPDGHDEICRGEMPGQVVWPMRGEGGHGFDPIFQPEGEALTFAEMSAERKNVVSHRADAFRKLVSGPFAGRARRFSTGSPFEREMGYSRAVAKGGWCFVSGVTGYDYTTMTMPEGAAAQARACFATIGRVLAEAGFRMEDIVRVQYTVTDAALVAEIGPVLGEALAAIRPAATMVVAGLIRPEMKVEIEVTAFRG